MERALKAREHGVCMAETMGYDLAQVQIYASYCYNSETERKAFLAGFRQKELASQITVPPDM